MQRDIQWHTSKLYVCHLQTHRRTSSQTPPHHPTACAEITDRCCVRTRNAPSRHNVIATMHTRKRDYRTNNGMANRPDSSRNGSLGVNVMRVHRVLHYTWYSSLLMEFLVPSDARRRHGVALSATVALDAVDK